MNLESILKKLIYDPIYYWEDNKRQKEKLEKRLSLAQASLGFTKDELLSDIFKITDKRVANNAKIVFIASIGSSGSHLFQSCISSLWPSIPLGEIYLPPKLIGEIECLSSEEKERFVNCYLMMHDYQYNERYNEKSLLINTLHHPKLSKYPLYSKNYSAALILRNPTDIVISRTYRKGEYKSYLSSVGKNVDDGVYLDTNIKKVNNFYKQSKNFKFDAMLNFDQLLADSDTCLVDLEKLTGKKLPNNASEIVYEVVFGGKSTNKYEGEKVSVSDEHVDYIRKNVIDITKI